MALLRGLALLGEHIDRNQHHLTTIETQLSDDNENYTHIKLRNGILQATADRLKDELKVNNLAHDKVKSALQNSEVETKH
jgi:hypothetical protein